MIKPKKRFGQHFLKDEVIISRIISAIAPRPDDNIVEIGPGTGVLTMLLLNKLKKLTVIELDRDLIDSLKERAKQYGELLIYNQDVLTFDFANLSHDAQKFRVVGNLPYNISTPLIFHLLNYSESITDMVFMLQKEVAHRLAALANSENYGRLSVMVQYMCAVNLLFDVPASAFSPPPKVMSSVITLKPYLKKPFIALNEQHFAEIVKTAFNQRRKTLKNSLKNLVSDHVWSSIDIEPNKRPEELSVAEFVKLSNECNR